MRTAFVFAIVAGLSLWAPLASAASEIEVILSLPESGHENHPAKIPSDTNRAMIPIDVVLKATEIACLQPGTFTVSISMTADDIASYGASPEPSSTTVTIPQGEPGPQTKQYTANAQLGLGVFWGGRPNTGAKQTYTITPEKVPEASGGPCLPSYSQKLPPLKIYTIGDDIVVAGNSTLDPEACGGDASACAPETTIPPGGNSPMPGTFLVVLAILGLVALRRRRL